MATASGGTKLSREEFRRQRELEAARKAGTIPAEVDEEGKEINPHIPQYISQAPWYIDTGAPTLRHQKIKKENDENFSGDWYERGIKLQASTKYRKGACENCGALTHKSKDCMDRPRKCGAKWTGKDIQPDELVQDIQVNDFDSKRDRWNGYDPNEYHQVIENFDFIEQQRKKFKEEEIEKKLADGSLIKEGTAAVALKAVDPTLLNEEERDELIGEDEEKYAEQSDLPGQKVDLKQRTTVRNLRIREDTAKYLRNLDIDSAYYDPKTRSMRENPNKDIDPSQAIYAGDNFVRYTGDAPRVGQLQLFAWEAAEKGLEIHLQAAPSETEKKWKQFNEKKTVIKTEMKQSILEKYGGEEYLETLPKELYSTSENYVEYSRTGQIIKGMEKAIPKSKYEEDVYVNNHTSVWGSFWEKGKWGYDCCHSFIKNSYCTGEEGKQAHKESKSLE